MKDSKIWSVLLFILILGFVVVCLCWYEKHDQNRLMEDDEALLGIRERAEAATPTVTERVEDAGKLPTIEPGGQDVSEVTVDVEARLHEMEVPLGKLLRLVFFNVIPEDEPIAVLEEIAPYLSEACVEYYKGYVECILYENDLPDFYPEEEGEYVWLWDEHGTQVIGVLPRVEYEIQYGEAGQADIFMVNAPRKEDEISLEYSVLEGGDQILVSAVDKRQEVKMEFRVIFDTDGLVKEIYMDGGAFDEQR